MKGSQKDRRDRTEQEQIRKRRHNMFKRMGEFRERYGMRFWVTTQMPNGRIYTYVTDPEQSIPTKEDIVKNNWVVVHKTPTDYTSNSTSTTTAVRDPPPFTLKRPLYDGMTMVEESE